LRRGDGVVPQRRNGETEERGEGETERSGKPEADVEQKNLASGVRSATCTSRRSAISSRNSAA